MTNINRFHANTHYTAIRQITTEALTGVISLSAQSIASGYNGFIATKTITAPSGNFVSLIYMEIEGDFFGVGDAITYPYFTPSFGFQFTDTSIIILNVYRSGRTEFTQNVFAYNFGSSSFSIPAIKFSTWIQLFSTPFSD